MSSRFLGGFCVFSLGAEAVTCLGPILPSVSSLGVLSTIPWNPSPDEDSMSCPLGLTHLVSGSKECISLADEFSGCGAQFSL